MINILVQDTKGEICSEQQQWEFVTTTKTKQLKYSTVCTQQFLTFKVTGVVKG